MRRRAAFLIFALLLVLVGGTVLWLRAQQSQYALNRQLIDALVKGDNKQALALVNEGASPNTRYKPTPIPSLHELVKQWLHWSPAPVNDSPTALSMACGALWMYREPKNMNDAETAEDARRQSLDLPDLVNAMLRHGANVNDNIGCTPLMVAACFGRRDSLRLLLEHGAEVNTAGEGGITALMYASSNPRGDMVRRLLECGADVNAKNKAGMTPLMYACCHLHAETVRLLLKNGAEVNAQAYDGETALHEAVQSIESPSEKANKNILRQLLAHGANPNLTTKSGDTPLKLAQSQERPNLVALLRQAGVTR